jgi:hypothetical protein
LNPVDFYLWQHLKSVVYAAPVANKEAFHHCVVDACQTISIFILCRVFIVCIFLCTVFRLIVVLFCVLCLIVVDYHCHRVITYLQLK